MRHAALTSLNLGILLALTPLAASATGTVTLAWDASPGTNVIANYNVYYGVASATYTNVAAAGTNLTVSISNLVEGTTYFFAATAVDTSGLESDYSTEVSNLIPIKTNNQPPTLDPIANLTINEGAGLQTVNLSGITSGATNEVQTLTVTASSSNTGLIPTPTVNYSSPNTTGSLTFTPVANVYGSAIITVTVNNGGVSNNIVSQSFTVTVTPVNQPPLTQLVLNGGFETGDFSYWIPSGNMAGCEVTNLAEHVHSGSYGAGLGSVGSLGYLSQNLPTVAGQSYLLSFWLHSPGDTPNEFLVSWNGSTLFDQTNVPAVLWTNLQFLVQATGSSSALEFGFRDDPTALGLDDISVMAVAASNISVTVQASVSGCSFTVDGTNYTSPQTFSWVSGSSHTLATTSAQSGGAATQYVWSTWSDGGAISHTITPTSATTYTANFGTQYYLTMDYGAGGNSVSPGSGWYNSGAVVSIGVTPSSGYTFSGWTGSGNGSYSGADNPGSVTMNGPIAETASFTTPPPTLNPLTDVTINENAGQQTVNLSGISSGATNQNQTLTVTAASSNTGLIPNPTVTYTSPNATGSIRFTPIANANGVATITVTVNNGGASNNIVSQSFTVTVTPVNQPPTLAPLANVNINENAGLQTVNLSGISSGATNEVQTLTVTASSSNTGLIPTPTVTYTSPNTTGSIRFTPLTNAYGAATITVTVNDGGTSNNIVSRAFTVTVSQVNTPPTISSITNRLIAADTATPAIPFTVGDAETPAVNLTLSGSSDNPTLVLPADIVFGGSSGNRTVTITPEPGQTGVANITITVSDGTDTASSVFQLSVRPRPAPPGSLRIVSTEP